MKQKKRRHSRIAVSLISMICAIYMMQIPAAAMTRTSSEVSISVTIRAAELLSEDIIVTKYRKYNNRLQYRRWNYTKQIWLDPCWIDV